MKAIAISKILHATYDKHMYQLSNSYVYSWECDFFSQLASGYHQEIEIKVTRSDFKADFKKIFHHYLTLTVLGAKVINQLLLKGILSIKLSTGNTEMS